MITEEKGCPLYNVGEELKVEANWVSVSTMKPTCLVLAQNIVSLTTEDVAYEQFGSGKKSKNSFECSGCTGLIRFEFKKARDYATLQMRLLAYADKKRQIASSSKVLDELKEIEVFKPLDIDDLTDLAALLQIKEYPYGFPICQIGEPGTHLFVMLNGRVEVLDADGVVLSEMSRGDVFGEMSLITGDEVSTTVMAVEPCEIATLNQKNFNYIIEKFPVLQAFLYKLVVRRIESLNEQWAEDLSSGMNGQVADIPVVDLCQMINSGHKTGRLKVEDEGRAGIIVFNGGEIVFAESSGLIGVEAFYLVMGMTRGRFRFIQGITRREKKLKPLGGFMALVMEGMKHQDEKGV